MRQFDDMFRVLDETRVGDVVNVTVRRDATERVVAVKLEQVQ